MRWSQDPVFTDWSGDDSGGRGLRETCFVFSGLNETNRGHDLTGREERTGDRFGLGRECERLG